MSYEASSSGAGLKAWGFDGGSFDKTKAFIGTDEAPTAAQLTSSDAASGSNALVIPVAQTAITVLANPPANCEIEEITNKQLESVMRGTIKNWGKIETASGSGCQAAPITRVVRAEGSGTTYQLKSYLNSINLAPLACVEGAPTWKQLGETGAGEEPNTVWPKNGVAGCAATTLSPLVTAAGGTGVVETVNATQGAFGYAALTDAEASRSAESTVLRLQNNGLVKLANATFAPPSLEGNDAANCAATQYAVPAGGRIGTGTGVDADWSAVTGSKIAIGGENYPLCTLTYDIALDGYAKAGFTSGQEQTVAAYLAGIVTAPEGQQALSQGKQFYAPLPTNGKAVLDVLGAARLAASKIGF